MPQARSLVAGALAVMFTGCGVGTPEPCDPLLGEERDIQLADIEFAAESLDGGERYYVVDRDDEGELRLFMGGADGLYRQEIRGSGGGSAPDGESLSVNFYASEAERTLLAEIPDSGPTRVALCENVSEEDEERFSTVDEAVAGGCAELVAVEDSVVRPFLVVDLEAEVVVEYHMELATGERVVVLRPGHDWDYEDFRLFFGPEDLLVEYKARAAMRAKDGGTTDLEFSYDGGEALAHFGIDGGPSTLTLPGSPGEELVPSAGDLSAYTFTCIQ